MSDTRIELIEWLRAQRPETVVEETVKKLREGVTVDDLWAAGALTAAHFVSNQARNLLGFVSHAMIGCEDARQSAAGQPIDIQELMLVQALAQVVMDLHDPCFAPYQLFEVWGITEDSVEESINQLRSDVQFGEWMRADHRLVGLERQIPREQLVDLILDIGLEGMVTDDHTLITPALSLDMMEITGWEEGFAMLRGTMRYSCTFPRNLEPYRKATQLIERFQLEGGVDLGVVDDTAADVLRREIVSSTPGRRPELVAKALAEKGLSANTVMSALSLAACDMYLQVDPVPHNDYDAVSREVAPIHIGTTLNILRTCLPRMFPRTRALAIVMGGCLVERGPSVLNEGFEFVPFEPSRSYPYPEDLDRLRHHSAEQLLDTLDRALDNHDVRETTASVLAFRDAGGNAEDLIGLLVRVACTDDGTLMHNVKHLHSCLGEFAASQNADRWNFLVGAAKWVSWYAGKNTGTYERAVRALNGVPVGSPRT